MTWFRPLLALVAFTACLVAPALAWARITRYAVIIGNNEGDADEAPLRYAERDGNRLYEVLRALGGFREEEMVLLLGRDSEAVQRVLISVNARLRSSTRDADQSVLLVFYSGHADADALHLGGSHLELSTLRELVRGSTADFRLLLVDACRSGALTRVKGATRAPAFDVALERRLKGEGLVFLTSSSANESAQESDELQSSFFTHYLVSGLVGAADTDQDGNITLFEAYRYAYHHTIHASSRTIHGTQHPTFEFDLRGQGGIVLTQVREVVQGRARLRFPPGRSYLVFADDEHGAVVSEVGLTDVAREISVKAGRYFIRGRARDHLVEGAIDVRSKEIRVITDDPLRRVEYARLARKGGTERRSAHGPTAAYQLRTSLWRGSGPCQGVRLGYALENRWLRVTSELGFCRAGFEARALTVTADQYDVSLALAHTFDVPVVRPALGLVGGASLLRQTFETAGRAPPRNTFSGYVAALAALYWDLPRGFYLITSLAAQVHVVLQERVDAEGASLSAIFTAQPTIGVGKWF